VADNGGGRHLQHQRGEGKVRGKPVQWRRTQRHDSLRGGDDSGALVETGEVVAVFGGGVDMRLPGD
jgi:hypothetical protein